MALREKFKNRPIVGVIAGVVLLGAATYMTFAFIRDYASGGPGTAYFSSDDGKTFFIDDIMRLPPFEHRGQTAVRAHVFDCNGNRVVGYLSRYTDESLKAFETAKAFKGTNRPPPNLDVIMNASTNGTQIKRPGQGEWVSAGATEQVARIRGFQCPDGSSGSEVEP